jgi:hypothetical protein
MTPRATKQHTKLKTYSVGYALEEGFRITVAARSVSDAERIVLERLDEEGGELQGSERIHYDDCITDVEEIDADAIEPEAVRS